LRHNIQSLLWINESSYAVNIFKEKQIEKC